MRKWLFCLAAAFCLTLTGLAWAEKYVPDPDAGHKLQSATQPITLVARIGHSLNHGGYYVMNNPRRQSGNKTIVNQNYKVLKALHQQDQAVTIQGRVNPLDFLANYIVIDRINGRPYHGNRAPLVPVP
ncbi:MAG: hypothetical protein WC443_12265 [Desulfobaccales bacterium]